MARKKKNLAPAKKGALTAEIASFKKSLDEMFENFFSGKPWAEKLPSLWKGKTGLWWPDIDLYETDKEVVVKADVPGCDKKDIRVDIEDNILTISGEKREEEEKKNKNFYQREQRMGSFQRSTTIPEYADADNARASCEKGVLKITFPKTRKAEEKTRKIDIE